MSRLSSRLDTHIQSHSPASSPAGTQARDEGEESMAQLKEMMVNIQLAKQEAMKHSREDASREQVGCCARAGEGGRAPLLLTLILAPS